MSKSRWKQLKRYFKLNNNLQDKKGEIGYDPCTKYGLVCKALIHNMNYVTKTADLYGAIDESTWGSGGCMGDCSSHLSYWLGIHADGNENTNLTVLSLHSNIKVAI